MARYPTFDEYAKKGNFAAGIKRCDELLSRNPKDAQLLIVKLQLLCNSNGDPDPILEQLAALQPPITDTQELAGIAAALDAPRKNVWPPPLTTGPLMAKLWDAAFKATPTNHKIDFLWLRFHTAVEANRLQDAQQALIAFKAFQPKNRAIYMAHAAYTQLLSASNDDLQARLAIGLARKAVTEKFDDDPALDCRVPGQIFALQGSAQDLETVKERASFRESKQVYEALKLGEAVQVNGAPEKSQSKDPAAVPSREWLVSETDSLKKDFSRLVEGQASADVLVTFVSNAVRLFHTSITSLDLGGRDRGAADACFLAISGLVKLFSDARETNYLFQAAFLADRLLKHNQHIHEARLILVYLYTRLGLGSLAISLFASLNVKEIQHDTVGHTLFTQLSILHPYEAWYPSGEMFMAKFEPHEATNKALGAYRRHEDKLADTEALVLEHNQTGMIFDLHELRDQLRSSFSRRMFVLEHRRIGRLIGKTPAKASSEVGPKVLANWTNIKDNRDFNAAFDYGFNVERALYGDFGQHELICNLAIDTAWSLVTTDEQPLIRDTEKLITYLQSLASEDGANRATRLVAHLLIPILHSRHASAIPNLLEPVRNLPIEALVSQSDNIAEHISDCYVYLDAMRIILTLCHKIKDPSEQVTELRDLARRHLDTIQTHAKKQAASLKAPDIRKRLTGIDLFDEQDIKTWCESVAQSAQDGWEGITKVKIP